MRRMLLAVLLGATVGVNTGCILPIYRGDPQMRTRQLIYTSEDLRHFLEEWDRFWFTNQPSSLTPYRTHGGII